ncbi:hypothetical protein DV736_g4693, partial [Chaetothyriales sp. CBS 134916]
MVSSKPDAMAAEPADCDVASRNGLMPDKVPSPSPTPPPEDGQMVTTTKTTTASTTRTVSGGSSWSDAVTALPPVPVSTDVGSQSGLQMPSALSVPQIKLDRPQSRPRSKGNKDRDTGTGTGTDTPRSNVSVTKHGWSSKEHRPASSASSEQQRPPLAQFQGLSLNLDGDSGFAEEFKTADMIKFSNRGSMMINGQLEAASIASTTASTSALPWQSSELRSARSRPKLTQEEEGLSEKLRTFYALGTGAASDTDAVNTMASKIGSRWHDSLGAKTDGSSLTSASRRVSTVDINDVTDGKPNSDRSTRSFVLQREEYELAGGIEDWADIDNAHVDRYGFIIPKQDTISTNGAKEHRGFSRISTSLHVAGEQPRRKGTKRSLRRSTSNGTRSPGPGLTGTASETSSLRPRSSPAEGGWQAAKAGVLNKHLAFRSRDQKVVDHAGDMLSLPSTARWLSGTGQSTSEDPRARRKEIEREEKWRKMARPTAGRADGTGGGMTFEFDTTSPKLIERTWKGVPDKWRATAWHAFLTASAKKHPDSLSDQELVRLFEEYQAMSSPDDVQIDIDVPRTISSHIMFRRRYRGGQRLLFHVLHAMSLHFSDTGYVQGMAALAATLLAYYEEEKAFVMLVRLWELRGLDRLYKSGFGGLMAALDDFEKAWLCDGELANRLSSLNIVPTAYGTRWYLTLFNYSIPFPAQLRVWDVFMLLGDDEDDSSTSVSAISASAPVNTESLNGEEGKGNGQTESEGVVQFGTTLDVLHAASAALIDGMRDILMDSEFENCMTVLTSWIPIKDVDMFMRVVKAEWTAHRGRMKR